jgi:UDP-N-acetylglucosamine 2-epimerase (non-hydrolysing)
VPNPYGFSPKSVAVVLGTRPEIIKLSHIIRLLDDAAWIVHTGQHYDPNLSGSFFAELNLPEPDVFLEVGGLPRGSQIGLATRRLDELFADHRPAAVMVQGDTNAVAAGALAANAREITLCHIEAGLRSHDRAMPEEHNRVIADHLADLCCAPTDVNVANLHAEGIPDARIARTGNTVVEAVQELLPDAADRARLCEQMGVEPSRFVLSTFHRPENVDDPDRYRTILTELAALDLPVILPLHPRSVRRSEEHGLGALLDHIRVVEPIGYRDFLGLQAESALVISDSGGVQEECSILKRPVIVVRNSTERPEVIGTFAQRVLPGPAIGATARPILADVTAVHEALADILTPYGDGTASPRSLRALADVLG